MKKSIGEIILCYQSAYYGPRQYCLKGSRLYERTCKSIWPSVSEKRSEDSRDSVYLANDLGRPFNKVFTLPLDTPYRQEENLPVLFIEYFSKTQTIENIFYDEKLEILQSIFSKVLLEEHWKSGLDLWKYTFDSLKEPLVILDECSIPVRFNSHFQKIHSINEDLTKKNRIQVDGEIFEKQSYPIMNEDKAYMIEHFVNVTSSFFLTEQIIQQQKMSALGQLADDIAHNLNNPLTGIRSMVQILVEELDDRYCSQKEILDEIEKATYRCQNIIKNFIQFSKQ